MFRRSSASSPFSSLTSPPSSIAEDYVEVKSDGSGYRYRQFKRIKIFVKILNYNYNKIKLPFFYRYYTKTSWESPSEITPVQNVVLCAVLLDEWLKELAAITQEHAIDSLGNSLELKI